MESNAFDILDTNSIISTQKDITGVQQVSRNKTAGHSFYRRLCDLAGVVYYMCVLYLGPFLGLYVYIYAFTNGYITLFVWLLYTAWLLYDHATPNLGGRPMTFCRTLSPWKCVRNYFSSNIHKTVELPPERNYLFVCHPHGVMVVGTILNFATDVTKFRDLFPGVKTLLAGFKYLFFMPLLRDFLLVNSVVAASKASLVNILTRSSDSDTARSVALVVGGAREMLEAEPWSLTLVLKERKGFVKIALRTGADIVPVFTFGENQLFTQIHQSDDNSLVKRFLVWLDGRTYFALPLTTSFIPRKMQLNTVVGRPITVRQTPQPTDDEINQVHQTYIQELCSLFERHKTGYGYESDQHLRFI